MAHFGAFSEGLVTDLQSRKCFKTNHRIKWAIRSQQCLQGSIPLSVTTIGLKKHFLAAEFALFGQFACHWPMLDFTMMRDAGLKRGYRSSHSGCHV
jgi:hypothetical protein